MLLAAEGLKGEGDAKAAVRVIAQEFGIRLPAEAPGAFEDDLDVLAADG